MQLFAQQVTSYTLEPVQQGLECHTLAGSITAELLQQHLYSGLDHLHTRAHGITAIAITNSWLR